MIISQASYTTAFAAHYIQNQNIYLLGVDQ